MKIIAFSSFNTFFHDFLSYYDDSVTLKFVNFFESVLNFSDTLNLKNIRCSLNSNKINTSDISQFHYFSI